MRRKIEIDEEFQEGEVVERWSKPKILIALLVLGGMGIAGYFLLSHAKDRATQVLGIESSPRISTGSQAAKNIKLPSQEDAGKLLEHAKQELGNITADNVSASDTGTLQKVIEEIQNIKTGSSSPTQIFCDLVCKK